MLDASSPDPDVKPQATSLTSVSGGVNIAAQHVSIGGDLVAGDKTVIGYTSEQVSALLTQISSTFQPKPFDGKCPYLGLDAFSEDDADRFFGRETLVGELVARVRESRFVVIAGPSGSGKSSLVRAGLIHALKQGALSTSDRWLYATLTPGRDPIESLALAMSRLAKSPDAGKYLREHSTEPSALHEFTESQLSDRKDQRAVIFVDQFEEVFTQVSKEDERLAFLNLLTHAATLENGRVTVLFALRSDFVSNCATYPQLNALLNQQFMQVGAMQPDDLVSAIARPALQVGLRIDPDLIAQIVNDMQDEPGALPLMQFALKDLFDARQAMGGVIALTLDDYLARGGLRKALERHADAAFAQLSDSEQQLARVVFSGLIEIGRGAQDTRRTAVFDELVPATVDAGQVRSVVQKLADARLITTDELGDVDIVTIAHERLIEAWPWLRKLINENREAISLQNQIMEDAKEWDEHQCDASYLYSGARLATAREELAGQKIILSELAQRFVSTSIEAEESARQREKTRQQQELQRLRTRNRIITVVGILAFCAMLVAVFFGVQSYQNADKAKAEANSRATAEAEALAQRDDARKQFQLSRSRELAARALSLAKSDFSMALLLSMEAYRVTDTVEARSNILSIFESSPRLETYLPGDVGVMESVAFNPDHRTLATGQGDGTIILWDVSNPRLPQQVGNPLKGHTYAVSSVAFSPDGKTLASGSEDTKIMLWDVSNLQAPQQLAPPLSGHTAGVNNLVFTADGTTLASAGGWDKTVILWDVSNPHAPGQLGVIDTGQTDLLTSIAFSPDGRMLASSDQDETIILWDISNRKTPYRLGQPLTSEHPGVSSVAFSPDGKTLASGQADGTIILRDVTNPQAPQPVGKPFLGNTLYVDSLAFSPDGKTLAAGGYDNLITLWDVSDLQSPRQLGDPLAGHTGRVWRLAFDPDGKTLASVSWDRTIILWDVSTPPMSPMIDASLSRQSDFVASVAFSPDNKTLASGSNDKTIVLWDVANPQAPQMLGKPLSGHGGAVYSVAFSPDGKTLASGSSDKTIILWDVSNPQAPRSLGTPLIGHSDAIENLAFSPDGRVLASGSDDKTIILWDVSNPESVRSLGEPLVGHTDNVRSVAFSPDGKRLASSGNDGLLLLWDTSNPQAPRQLSSLPTITGNPLPSVAFSIDNQTLAAGSIDHTVSLWDVSNPQDSKPIGRPLVGHTDTLMSVVFSRDGKTLASGSLDGTVILWDISNLQAPQRLGEPLNGYGGAVSSVAFSPDGTLVASGNERTISLWNVNPAEWQTRACQIVGRNLTRAEWAQYMGDEPYRKTCDQWSLEPEATPTPVATSAP